MDSMKYIYQLDGYLKSLSTINGSKCCFGAAAFEMEVATDLEDSVKRWLKEYNYEAVKLSFSDQKKVYSLLASRLFRSDGNLNCTDNKRLINMILEDINEYIGLFSTALNRDGVFHPIIRNKSMIGDVPVESGGYHNLIFVPVENYLVVISLKLKVSTKGKRA